MPQKKKPEQDEEIVFTDEEVGEDNQIKKLRKKLDKCLEEKQEYLDGWQRAKADYANSKKDEEDRRAVTLAKCREDILREFLPTVDSFEMAFSNKEAWESVDQNWRTGVEYIHSQLLGAMENQGITVVGEVGESFDPNSHDSIETVEASNEDEDGVIVAVIQKGYKLGESVLRPARVHVGEFKKDK